MSRDEGFGEVVLQRAKLNPKPRDPFDRGGVEGRGSGNNARGEGGGRGCCSKNKGGTSK